MGLLLRRCSGKGLHLAMAGEPRGFSQVTAGFSSYDGEFRLPLVLAQASPIFHSSCEGKPGAPSCRAPGRESKSSPARPPRVPRDQKLSVSLFFHPYFSEIICVVTCLVFIAKAMLHMVCVFICQRRLMIAAVTNTPRVSVAYIRGSFFH